MGTAWLEWLLDVENIRLGRDAPVMLDWRGPVQPWMVFALAVITLLAIWGIYRREGVRRWAVIALGLIRVALIALVVAAFCGPVLILQRNRVDRSTVVMLFDTSKSMNREDPSPGLDRLLGLAVPAKPQPAEEAATVIPAGDEEGGSGATFSSDPDKAVEKGNTESAVEKTAAMEEIPSRYRQAVLSLETEDRRPLRTLLAKHSLRIYGFDSELRLLAGTTLEMSAEDVLSTIDSQPIQGEATDFARCAAELARRERAHRVSAVVLFSDGRFTTPTEVHALAQEADARGIAIYPVLLGSSSAPVDLSIELPDTSRIVWSKDLATITARVTAAGLSRPERVSVVLEEAKTGLELKREFLDLSPERPTGEVAFQHRPDQTGPATLRARVEPFPGEFTLANNVQDVELEVRDERLHVLFVDGYPRFDYRFMKNALVREPSMEVSVLLLEADPDYVQEGTIPIRHFPDTQSDLWRYDVVLFGDVDPRSGWLSQAQMDLLVEFVSVHGGGFGAFAGARACPRLWVGTPLEKLLPVVVGDISASAAPTTSGPFQARMTQDGMESPILRILSDPEANIRFFEALPPLYWSAAIDGAKPGATVLLERPSAFSSEMGSPLLVVSRYGAGRVAFQGTDDTWLWRRHRGEFWHDAYCVQLVRSLMSSEPSGTDRRYTLTAGAASADPGAVISVQLEIHEPDLMLLLGDEVVVDAKNKEGSVAGRVHLNRVSPDRGLFEGWLRPTISGELTLELENLDTPAGMQPGSARIRVASADPEMLTPEADHDMLRRLAEVTGGEVIEMDRLSDAFEQFRDRSRQFPDDIVEPLWDSKLVLILFVLLITSEWTMRRAVGLN